MAGGAGSFRDDSVNLLINAEVADHLAERMAQRFHALNQKAKGGAVDPFTGAVTPNPLTKNQWGGKAIIKFNPTNDEIVQGIKQTTTLFTWESPDGLPHYVTIDVGRLAAGIGGPGADGAPGGLPIVSPASAQGQGSVGGGTWPAATDGAGNPLSYRPVAQILIGTPGTMQDPFFVDINRGQRFTAVASYVAVTAQMNGPPINEQTGQVLIPFANGFSTAYRSGSMAVYATLGAAVSPSLAPVTYTQFIDNDNEVKPFPTFVRIIPPRANFLLPLFSANKNDQLVVSFFDNTGFNIAATSGATAPSGSSPLGNIDGAGIIAPIPIPVDAYGVIVASFVAVAVNYRLVYQLSV